MRSIAFKELDHQSPFPPPPKRLKTGRPGVCLTATRVPHGLDLSSNGSLQTQSSQRRHNSALTDELWVVEMNSETSKNPFNDSISIRNTFSRGADNRQTSQVIRVSNFKDLVAGLTTKDSMCISDTPSPGSKNSQMPRVKRVSNLKDHGIGPKANYECPNEVFNEGTKDFSAPKRNNAPILREQLPEGVSNSEVRCGAKVDPGNPGTEDEFLETMSMVPDSILSSIVGDNTPTSNGTDDPSILKSIPESGRAEDQKASTQVVYEGANIDIRSPAIKYEFIIPDSNHGKHDNLDTSKMSVSLIDCFTKKQIEEHILSLEQETNESSPTNNGNACQLCKAAKLLLAPSPKYCSSCGEGIKRDVIYYNSPEEKGTCYFVCSKCYKNNRGGSVTISGEKFSKKKLLKRKNNEQPEESWVQCDRCECWQHQICALYNDKKDIEGKAEYICPYCCLKGCQSNFMKASKYNAAGAKDLPRTNLSDLIEQRLFDRLKEERQKTAKDTGRSIDEVPEPANLLVRVVHNAETCLAVKKQFRNLFKEEKYPTKFHYRSKVIVLFQNIEGVDVCLFMMYVQEYGSECAQPNQRCVYISYIDSVKFFKPERKSSLGGALRTFVYHEILIGYLEYCKKRGFTTCYLWACPPRKGDDYIFYCHPETQKTPKNDKLRHWYHLMLNRASDRNIVVKFTNLYDEFFVPNGKCKPKITTSPLPYFDGDYWTRISEDAINDIERGSRADTEGNLKKWMTKRALKAIWQKNPSGATAKYILLTDKLRDEMDRYKEDFIVVHLQYICTNCHCAILSGWRWFCSQCKNYQLCERCQASRGHVIGKETHSLNAKEKHKLCKVMVDDVASSTEEDNDRLIENSLFTYTHTFLTFCQRNFYQFDTFRRAKHSSMMILHYFHEALRTPTCGICGRDVPTERYL